jgi:hypothetical protein
MKTRESVAAFYGEQDGYALVDERNYPPELQAHLRWEAETVARHAPRYALVVEIGCMDGRLHAERLVGLGVGYLGIDLVASAIERCQARLGAVATPGAARARAGDVLRLDQLLAGEPDLPAGPRLALLPFNVVGNLPSPWTTFPVLRACALDVLILSYRTTPAANAARRAYYEACGYRGLRMAETTVGVRFSSQDGLDSDAFHPARLVDALREHGYRVAVDGADQPVSIGYHGTLSRP